MESCQGHRLSSLQVAGKALYSRELDGYFVHPCRQIDIHEHKGNGPSNRDTLVCNGASLCFRELFPDFLCRHVGELILAENIAAVTFRNREHLSGHVENPTFYLDFRNRRITVIDSGALHHEERTEN